MICFGVAALPTVEVVFRFVNITREEVDVEEQFQIGEAFADILDWPREAVVVSLVE